MSVPQQEGASSAATAVAWLIVFYSPDTVHDTVASGSVLYNSSVSLRIAGIFLHFLERGISRPCHRRGCDQLGRYGTYSHDYGTVRYQCLCRIRMLNPIGGYWSDANMTPISLPLKSVLSFGVCMILILRQTSAQTPEEVT